MPSSQKRPELRTKTGCLTCRKQKKKCDERRPACSDCSKFRRVCIWPTVLTDRRHGSRALSTNSNRSSSFPVSASATPPQHTQRTALPIDCSWEVIYNSGYNLQNQVTWYHPATPRSDDRMLFNHFTSYVMPRAIRSKAHPIYAEYKDAYQLGFQVPGVMNVYIGIAALYIAKDDEKSSLVATNFYTRSINTVWSKIKNDEVDGTEDWLYISTYFMSLFELARFEIYSQFMLHLEGLAQLFAVRRSKAILPDVQKPIHRLVAEAFTYRLATAAVLSDNLDRIAAQFTWSDVNIYTETKMFPHASELANSPILGLQKDLYQIIFQITRLSRHTPLDQLSKQKAIGYSNELDSLKLEVTRNLSYLNEGDEYESQKGTLVYILASQIFLTKVLNPETDCINPNVRQLASQSLSLIQTCKPRAACTTYYCWPLIILACAVKDNEGRSVIKTKLAEVWEDLNSGQAYRTTKIIHAIWDDRDGSCGGEVASSCNLDRLIYKGG